jgi:hypothetical protein
MQTKKNYSCIVKKSSTKKKLTGKVGSEKNQIVYQDTQCWPKHKKIKKMLNNVLNLYSMTRSSAVVSFTCFCHLFSQELQQTMFFMDLS